MKWLFFVFLLANLVVFSFSQLSADHAVSPRSREINASKVQIVTGQLLPAKKASAASSAASSPAEASAVAASRPVDVARAASQAGKLACLRWSGFSTEQANSARSRIKSLGLSANESGGTENAKVWIYIPPQDSLDAARKKAQQIADLGVDDYFVVNNGSKWQNAVSLGVYSSREAADRRLSELKAKGVKSAVVRDKDDSLKPVSFLLKNVGEAERKKLAESSSNFRGVELREVNCR